MKRFSLIATLMSFIILTGCDDVSSKIITKVEQKSTQYSEALKAAKDVERQLLEVDQNRRKLLDELSTPGS